MSVHTGRSSSVYAGIPWGYAGKEEGRLAGNNERESCEICKGK